MRKRWLGVAAVALVGLGWSAGQVFSQDTGGGKEGGGAPAGGEAAGGPSAEEMAAWMEYMTPGDEHARMAKHEGEWTVAGTMWMAEGAPPMETQGKAKLRMILGGRYQMQEFSGDFMGMPFDGVGIGGYDNALQSFQSIWVDSGGTGMYFSEGKRNAETGAVSCSGKVTEPSGERFIMRDEVVEKDDDHFTVTMYRQLPDGKEHKMMQLNYTRVKAATPAPAPAAPPPPGPPSEGIIPGVSSAIALADAGERIVPGTMASPPRAPRATDRRASRHARGGMSPRPRALPLGSLPRTLIGGEMAEWSMAPVC